ncbi:hypothetical protein GDO81_018698 [Engystomops pustulosus]|uniref:TIL domain-containing protein n=1 Tax=Engystomops pustulosus TaxID=76066 RepID=A0AAV6YX66_ENGPU|nr:hypothetical protein GDO81_018698 [Engystomops pustulosus]
MVAVGSSTVYYSGFGDVIPDSVTFGRGPVDSVKQLYYYTNKYFILEGSKKESRESYKVWDVKGCEDQWSSSSVIHWSLVTFYIIFSNFTILSSMDTMKILLCLSVIALVFLSLTNSLPTAEQSCPEGAAPHSCGGCMARCPVPYSGCYKTCRSGCRCTQKGYLIGPDQKCIPQKQCPSFLSDPEHCPVGAEIADCAGCKSYCPVPDMVCRDDCHKGCKCKQDGYVISPKGTCIPIKECP